MSSKPSPDRAVTRGRERFVDKVEEALGDDHFVARDYLVRAKADTIRLAATQLLTIGTQRRAWERRMGVLLLGVARGR